MARRGDILRARRRLGFGAKGTSESFVIVQSDQLAGLDTVLVAPLDADAQMYNDDPLVVHVTSKEAGTTVPQVVLVHLVTAASREKFAESTAGRLSPKSMAAIDESLVLALQL